MKFPVSREQLQDIKKDVEEEIIEYNIEKAIDNIKERIIMHAYQGIQGGLSNTKLKIDISNIRFKSIIPDKWRAYMAYPLVFINPYQTHFEIIKEKLIELFPGVSFETDPLKTYMLVDWS